MVRLRTLDPPIGVQIPASQPTHRTTPWKARIVICGDARVFPFGVSFV
jgi:hypothetical protein